MSAPDSVTQLVEKFHRDKERFEHPKYNEAQLREEFVNPFFRALGWDLGEQVLHEAALRSGGTIKHPDYTFLAGARRAFYVETKKPSINIGNSIEPAEQLRSYGWSGDTALGVLTNFAEFAVYDCRIEPVQGDSPEEARVMYLTSSQYLDEWDRLRETLSYEAVREGKHGDILETTAKGVLRVDEAFLRDMEVWRVDLAPDIYKQARFIHRRLSQRELNHLVQRTIDRIVFLRIAEDRNLESYGRLERAAAVRRNSYNEIKKLYLDADRRYNSGLFHFDPKDKSRPDADTLSLDIRIGDGILRKIIADLYPPKSRYQFSVISADILGQVYERFLGKVIEVRSDGEKTEVTVEEKPEVRKAGGVYYTPGYIVDYIVENTLGKLLAGKSPEQATELRVLDPACGSGSFLVGAYQYLLDWHLNYYDAHYSQYRMRCRDSGAGLILTTREKRRILLNNIYGVDLDQNAVEVSKLSLLLKMLEKENEATGRADMEEPILPDLSGNIKWGNSLIGSDFFPVDDLAEKDDEELLRVKPFDWDGKDGFGEIMQSGGFDAVIGNPPYVRQETLGREFKDYAKQKFETYAGTADLYTYFIERGVKLLNDDGLFGIIVANKWLRARYGKPLRQWLKEQAILEIVDFGDLPVFEQATTYPCILTIGKSAPQETFSVAQVESLDFVKLQEYVNQNAYDVLREALDDGGWSLSRQETQQLFLKISDCGVPLAQYVNKKIYRGILTGLNEAFVIDKETKDRLIEEHPSSAKVIKPFLAGRNIKRYAEPVVERYVILIPCGWTYDNMGISGDPWRFVQQTYPAIANHLESYREKAEKRWDKGDYWWELRPCAYYDEFGKPKIIVPTIVKAASYFLDRDGFYSNDKTTIIVSDDMYLYGLLNSKVLDFVMHQISATRRGGYFEYKPMYLAQLPIRAIDFDNPDDVEMHDDMVKLVDEMLDMHRQLAGLSLVKRGVIEALIERTDREIDALVYRLYGLTEDEVAVVEKG